MPLYLVVWETRPEGDSKLMALTAIEAENADAAKKKYKEGTGMKPRSYDTLTAIDVSSITDGWGYPASE